MGGREEEDEKGEEEEGGVWRACGDVNLVDVEDDEDVDDEDDDGKRAVGSNQCDWEGRTSPSFTKK